MHYVITDTGIDRVADPPDCGAFILFWGVFLGILIGYKYI